MGQYTGPILLCVAGLILMITGFFLHTRAPSEETETATLPPASNYYWEIKIFTYPRYENQTPYFNRRVDKFNKSGLRVENIMEGFVSSEMTSYEDEKQSLIEHTLRFRKAGEDIYFVDQNTGERQKLKY